MKKLVVTATVFLTVFIGTSKAQDYEKKTVHTGENLQEISYFLFPSFENATIKLKNGGQLASKINFNLLICQMQFINVSGDTLNIAKPEDVDSIFVDSSIFYYNECYYEIFGTSDAGKIIVSRKASYEPVKIGALGQENQSGTGIASFSSLIEKGLGEKKLTINEDVQITEETTYFLVAPNTKKFKANKNGFLNFFSSNKQQIENYLKNNKINFNKQTDLKKLFLFCVSLKSI